MTGPQLAKVLVGISGVADSTNELELVMGFLNPETLVFREKHLKLRGGADLGMEWCL